MGEHVFPQEHTVTSPTKSYPLSVEQLEAGDCLTRAGAPPGTEEGGAWEVMSI